MSGATRITALAALASLAAPAAANHLAPLYQYAAQVRSQMVLVRAQTEVTFGSLPRGRLLSDDILDELDDLCRQLDRFETQLAEAPLTRMQFRRLERLAHRIDDQACEVEEEVREAIARLHRRASRRPVAQHYTSGGFAYPGVTRHTVGHRGIRLVIGGGRFNVDVGGPGATAISHHVARPTLASLQPQGVFSPPCDTLRGHAAALRLAAKQLLAVVCH